jgi:thiamine biosynthesis lipoprotein
LTWLHSIIVILFAGLVGSTPEPQRFEAVEAHMGTLVQVTVYTPDEQTARRAFRAAFDRIGDLDRILSDYRPDSELALLSTEAVGRDVPISDDLFEVLHASQQLAEATGGAFDVTQGPVIRLWREARKSGRVPERAALEEAAARSGYRKLHIDAEHRTVRLDQSRMALDVGAIGKGYAASEALEAIARLGVRSALVAVSGDLAFSEAPPGQRGWRIALHSGEQSIPGAPAFLELTYAAVSTAGSSEQHVDAGGRRYSHIIDPASRTGLAYDITVTVVARHGLEADGLDTAVSVVGADRGLALIESHPDAAALIVERTSAGTRVRQSSRFLELVNGREQFRN